MRSCPDADIDPTCFRVKKGNIGDLLDFDHFRLAPVSAHPDLLVQCVLPQNKTRPGIIGAHIEIWGRGAHT